MNNSLQMNRKNYLLSLSFWLVVVTGFYIWLNHFPFRSDFRDSLGFYSVFIFPVIILYIISKRVSFLGGWSVIFSKVLKISMLVMFMYLIIGLVLYLLDGDRVLEGPTTYFSGVLLILYALVFAGPLSLVVSLFLFIPIFLFVATIYGFFYPKAENLGFWER